MGPEGVWVRAMVGMRENVVSISLHELGAQKSSLGFGGLHLGQSQTCEIGVFNKFQVQLWSPSATGHVMVFCASVQISLRFVGCKLKVSRSVLRGLN